MICHRDRNGTGTPRSRDAMADPCVDGLNPVRLLRSHRHSFSFARCHRAMPGIISAHSASGRAVLKDNFSARVIGRLGPYVGLMGVYVGLVAIYVGRLGVYGDVSAIYVGLLCLYVGLAAFYVDWFYLYGDVPASYVG